MKRFVLLLSLACIPDPPPGQEVRCRAEQNGEPVSLHALTSIDDLATALDARVGDRAAATVIPRDDAGWDAPSIVVPGKTPIRLALDRGDLTMTAWTVDPQYTIPLAPENGGCQTGTVIQ